MNQNLLGANSAGDLSKILEAHKAIRRQTEFVLDNRVETTDALVTKYKKLISNGAEVFDLTVKAFEAKGYDKTAAVAAAGQMMQSPWFGSVLSLGL